MALNKCKTCGCDDSFLTTPAPCPTPAGCPEPEPCSEIIDAQCAIYTGAPISISTTVVVNTNDSVSEALTNIVPRVIPYKIFRGLLTQTGTAAPVITTLENTLGATFTSFYSGVGAYTLVLSSSIFASNKTYLNAQLNITNGGQTNTIRSGVQSSNALVFFTYNVNVSCCDVLANGLLNNAPFEVLVYP